MQLTIILTSYSRKNFVTRAVKSVLAQTNPNWRLIIQDDGSGQSVLYPLRRYAESDHRITLREHPNVTNRTAVTRYAVLINEVLTTINGLVGYMCDNVEYKPELVDSVLAFFEHHPEAFSGYVYHERDAWKPDGSKRLGKAEYYGHWNYTPPITGAISKPMGMLDHSQVFHRLPIAARWEENRSALKNGDGVFFERLIAEKGAIKAIRPGKVLTVEHLIS